jgi:hypothetical protein
MPMVKLGKDNILYEIIKIIESEDSEEKAYLCKPDDEEEQYDPVPMIMFENHFYQ